MAVKKILVILLLMSCLAVAVFAQNERISDYFPAKEGMKWIYRNSDDQESTSIGVLSSNGDGNGEFTFRFSASSNGAITDFTEYSILDNKLYITSITTALQYIYSYPYGNRKHKDHIVLDVPGKNWRNDADNGEHSLFTSSKSSVSYDGKTYADCICVEETRGTQRTRNYFAKNIGLVCSQMYSQEKGWYIIDKLFQYISNDVD